MADTLTIALVAAAASGSLSLVGVSLGQSLMYFLRRRERREIRLEERRARADAMIEDQIRDGRRWIAFVAGIQFRFTLMKADGASSEELMSHARKAYGEHRELVGDMDFSRPRWRLALIDDKRLREVCESYSRAFTSTTRPWMEQLVSPDPDLLLQSLSEIARQLEEIQPVIDDLRTELGWY